MTILEQHDNVFRPTPLENLRTNGLPVRAQVLLASASMAGALAGAGYAGYEIINYATQIDIGHNLMAVSPSASSNVTGLEERVNLYEAGLTLAASVFVGLGSIRSELKSRLSPQASTWQNLRRYPTKLTHAALATVGAVYTVSQLATWESASILQKAIQEYPALPDTSGVTVRAAEAGSAVGAAFTAYALGSLILSSRKNRQ